MSEFHIDESLLKNLSGKVAVVTGGSSGIGRGAVEYFTKHGAKVVAGDVNSSQDPLPSGAIYQNCNVKNWSEIVKLFEVARKEFGSVDIVCANAGINDRQNLLNDVEEEPSWDVLDVNLKGVMMTLKEGAIQFRRNSTPGGVLIITGSITSFVPAHEGVYVYAACKYACLGMLRTMRMHLPKQNIRINLIAPYLTATGMREQKKPKTEYYKDQPVNQPIEIAKAIGQLAADPNANGKAIVCVGQHYYETEEMREKLLPQVVSSEVTENWAKVLSTNPFVHMAKD